MGIIVQITISNSFTGIQFDSGSKEANLLAWVVLLLAYSVDVCGIDLVPRGHVFLHAGRHAGLLAA
jgi:hypothetical protein